jgi:hypothetical protein
MNSFQDKPLLAFHNDPAIKQTYIARVKAHRLAGDIRKNYWWDDNTGTGCAVGCTVDGGNPAVYETELGIPVHLAWLESAIHAKLAPKRAELWAEQFLSAITPGDDLSSVAADFIYWLLTDPNGARGNCSADEVFLLDTVVDLYARRINGDEPSDREWDATCFGADIAVQMAKADKESRLAGSLAWSASLAAHHPEYISDAAGWAGLMVTESEGGELWERMAGKLLALLEAAERPRFLSYESSIRHRPEELKSTKGQCSLVLVG